MWTELKWTRLDWWLFNRPPKRWGRGGGEMWTQKHKNCKTWQEMEPWLNAYGIKEVRVGERALWKRAWWLFNIQNPSPDLTLLSVNIVGRHINTAITTFLTPHIGANSIKSTKSLFHMKNESEKMSLTAVLLLTWLLYILLSYWMSNSRTVPISTDLQDLMFLSFNSVKTPHHLNEMPALSLERCSSAFQKKHTEDVTVGKFLVKNICQSDVPVGCNGLFSFPATEEWKEMLSLGNTREKSNNPLPGSLFEWQWL